MPPMGPTTAKTRVGFLGPHGTFAEEALLTQADLAAGEAVPFRDVPHVITAVERGEVDLGIVPIEIEDHPENLTRFVIVGHGIPARSGHDKTSVVCFQRQDRPGSLLAILQEFAARSINLTKLESRPTKQSLGDYCFFIDFEGHLDDEIVADCLRNLRAKQAQVKFLGSYPVAGDDGHVRRHAMNKAWRDADTWL